MSNPLANWQAIRLNKPMTVNVPYFPEAGIVAKEGEKIVVRIPAGSTVEISIKGPKDNAKITPVPLPMSQQPPAQISSPQPAPHQPKNKGSLVYKAKATNNNQSGATDAPAATNNNASAANGVTNGGDGQQQHSGNRNPKHSKNSNRQKNHQNQPVQIPSGAKVVTAEDLKRQREEQAKHEAWIQQRKEMQRREREEQDKRYQERLARQKKAKEEADAKRKEELEKLGQPVTEETLAVVGEKGEAGKKTCWVCDSEAHISRKCPLRCKRSGCNIARGPHAVKDCQEVCQLCNNKGHDEWFCDKRCPVCKRIAGGDAHLPEHCPVTCGLCGGKGHRSRDCDYSYQNRAH